MQERVSTCLIFTTIFALIRYRWIGDAYFKYFQSPRNLFDFWRRNFFRKICFPSSYFELLLWNRFYSRAILIIHFIIGAYILPLCSNFSHEKSILRAANLKYTLTSSRTRVFFFFSFSRTKIFFARTPRKQCLGIKRQKKRLKRQPWKFLMETENGCVHRVDRKFLMKWTNGERERERNEELADDVENETTVAHDFPMSRMIKYESSISQSTCTYIRGLLKIIYHISRNKLK